MRMALRLLRGECPEVPWSTQHVTTEAVKSYIRFDPLGIIVAIMPWNFPFWQAFRFSIPAICAGNVVVLERTSNVPMPALAIEDSFKKAEFPDNVFKTLFIDALRTHSVSSMVTRSMRGAHREQRGGRGSRRPFRRKDEENGAGAWRL